MMLFLTLLAYYSVTPSLGKEYRCELKGGSEVLLSECKTSESKEDAVIVRGKSYLNFLHAFDSATVTFADEVACVVADDSFVQWSKKIYEKMTGEPSRKTCNFRNTKQINISHYGVTKFEFGKNSKLEDAVGFNISTSDHEVSPTQISWIDQNVQMSNKHRKIVLFIACAIFFCLADLMSKTFMIKFLVMTPTVALLFAFVVGMFLWRHANILFGIPIALASIFFTNDSLASDENIASIAVLTGGGLTIICLICGYGVAADKFQCCGTEKGRVETVMFLVSTIMKALCATGVFLLPQSMAWAGILTLLLFVVKQFLDLCFQAND